MSIKNTKLLNEFKTKLVEKGVDLTEFEDYFSTIENNMKDKKYGLVWEEHTEDLEKELLTKFPILVEDKSLRISKGKEFTNNLLIEGDNLESLTALRNMGKKVDVIYIDPPYNTGNRDFVYEDRYVDGEDGFRHSKWLSFMEKRLKLARDLMTEDGVMFISIDDNEQAQLKLLCDQVFGEENVETMAWHKVGDDSGRLKVTHRFRKEHEYVLVCYKNKTKTYFKKYEAERNYKNKYNNPDNDHRGNFKQGIISHTEAKSNKNGKNFYTVTTPSGRKVSRQWRVGEEEFKQLREDGRIYFGKDGNSIPSIKVFLSEKRMATPTSILEGLGTAKSAGKGLEELFGSRLFSYPKPVGLIKHLLKISSNPNATFLDFFAGSGTTGHAVLELNKEDGGNRNFILCTNNENNICREVTYERINQVINGYTTPKGKTVEGIPANLTYLKTGLEDKDSAEEVISLEDNLLSHALNSLKVKYGLGSEEELIEDNVYKLEDNTSNYYLYNNFYVDEAELKELGLNNTKKNIVYVSADNLNDSNLLIFDEIRSIDELLVYK